MKSFALVSALALAVTAGAAEAATMLVSFTDGSADGIHFSFLQDSNPTPISSTWYSATVPIWGWKGMDYGPLYPIATRAKWYINPGNGGLFEFPENDFGVFGDQAFTYTYTSPIAVIKDPVFAPGTYVTHYAWGDVSGTLTVAYAPSVAPEPAAWAMVIAGFGLLGLALRGRRAIATA